MHEPALYFRENVAGGIALLEAMRDAGVGRLVISSTASVYGMPEVNPVTEDAPLQPINAYGETKRSLEAAAGWFAKAYGMRVASLRYFNVAGASASNGERHDPETHLIPNVLAAAAGGPPVTLFGTDYPTRRTAPRSATTSTSSTSPTRTGSPSRRQRRTIREPPSRSCSTSAAASASASARSSMAPSA